MKDKRKQSLAVIELWKPIRKNAYRIVNCIVHDPHLTEDILQEALIAAFDKFDTLRDVSKFDSWFYTIATRKAYNMIRKTKKVVPVEEIYSYVEKDIFDNSTDEDVFLKVENNDELLNIIKRLPQHERHLLHLRFMQDMKIADIAGLTGIKIGTLKSSYHRMYKKMRDIYTREYSYD